MEFNEKLQELRAQRGLTQEELAQALYVSRTAVAKWEQGKGYPNIDSLKAISRFFSVTIDQLLSGDQLLSLAEDDSRQKANRLRTLLFALLDLSTALFLFLPLFAQTINGTIQEVSLLNLTQLQPYLKLVFLAAIGCTVLYGLLTLILQGRIKPALSLLPSSLTAFLFVLSRQPYAAAFALALLLIKAAMLIKQL